MKLWKALFLGGLAEMIKQIIKAEFTMLVGEIKQYYFNYIFYNISIILLFYGLFYNNFNNNSSDTIIPMLVCLVLWQVCSNSLEYLCYVIQDEALMGTLEQMFVSKTSFITILFAKIIVNMSFVIFKGILLFIVCMLLFGQLPHILSISVYEWLFIIFICVITTFTFYCIGSIFGGLALYFKRISSILGIVDYLLLFFTGIMNDINSSNGLLWFLISILPIAQANKFIYITFNEGIKLYYLFYFVLICIFFIIISVCILLFLVKKAKKNGKLGQY